MVTTQTIYRYMLSATSLNIVELFMVAIFSILWYFESDLSNHVRVNNLIEGSDLYRHQFPNLNFLKLYDPQKLQNIEAFRTTLSQFSQYFCK